MIDIRPGRAADTPGLTALWRRSVEASHAFLKKEDIDDIEQSLPSATARLEIWVAETDDRPVGFMGMDGDTIVALFVDPESMGKGVGTMLLNHAKVLRGPAAMLKLDVNEQNPNALAFYLSRGFRPIGRSEIDHEGGRFRCSTSSFCPDRRVFEPGIFSGSSSSLPNRAISSRIFL